MDDVTDGPPGGDPAFQEELAAALSDRILHLIILPTEQCNFRCTYCYEDFAIGRMAPETVTGVKRLLDRRIPGLRRLDVSWFGGEPLLAPAIVRDVSTHVSTAVADRPGTHYRGDMTTNGYLLDVPMAERLASVGVDLYQVSLDGPEPSHDATRVRRNGGSSFRRIWRNLLAIRKSDLPVRVSLRIHLTPDNLPTMPEFARRVRDTFLGDDRFSADFKAVGRWGGPNDATMEVLSRERQAEAVAELTAVLRTGLATFQPPAEVNVCYAARPNSLVIRANGRVGKCTVALTDPSNDIGRLTPEGTLELDNARLSPWLRGWVARDWQAVGCPYAGMPRPARRQLLQISPAPPRAVA